MIDYLSNVTFCLMVDALQAVGAGPLGEDLFDRRDPIFAAQLGDFLADQLKQLAQEGAVGQLDLFTDVDHFAVQPVAGGAQFVLVDQLFGKDSECDGSLAQLPVPEHEGLTPSADGDGFVDAKSDVTDAGL